MDEHLNQPDAFWKQMTRTAVAEVELWACVAFSGTGKKVNSNKHLTELKVFCRKNGCLLAGFNKNI